MDIATEMTNLDGELRKIIEAVRREAIDTATPPEHIADQVTAVPGWHRNQVIAYVTNLRTAQRADAILAAAGLHGLAGATPDGGITTPDKRVVITFARDPAEHDVADTTARVERAFADTPLILDRLSDDNAEAYHDAPVWTVTERVTATAGAS